MTDEVLASESETTSGEEIFNQLKKEPEMETLNQTNAGDNPAENPAADDDVVIDNVETTEADMQGEEPVTSDEEVADMSVPTLSNNEESEHSSVPPTTDPPAENETAPEAGTSEAAKTVEFSSNSDAQSSTVENPLSAAVREDEIRKALEPLTEPELVFQKKSLAQRFGFSATEIQQLWKSFRAEAREKKTQEKQIKAAAEKAAQSVSQSLDPLSKLSEICTPADEDQDIYKLIVDIKETIEKYVVFNDYYDALTVALWTLATYFVEEFFYATYLMLTGPMNRCGKSQLLTVLSKLAKHPLVTSNLSAPVMFRILKDHGDITMFIDEVDTFLKPNSELNGIINCGITRETAFVYRCEKTADGNFVPVAYPCFGFKVLSGIKAAENSRTLTDRCVVINLKRRTKNEPIERLHRVDEQIWTKLTARCAKAAIQYREAVANCVPEVPSELDDRAANKWESLLALATVSGDPVLISDAKKAAIELSRQVEEVPTFDSELLFDIRRIFTEPNLQDAWKSYENRIYVKAQELVEALNSHAEMDWKNLNHGKALSAKTVARHLKPFGICSRMVSKEGNCKCYFRDDFADAFNRYLPPLESTASEEKVEA